MSKWGKVDFKELQELRIKIDNIKDSEKQAFCEAAAKELAAKLLRKVIKRTPVGQYPKGSGMVGGTLRRGWTGQGGNAASFVQSLPIKKEGNNYVIDIINPVEYGSYVEFGHRTRNHNGWVQGRFMLTISESELMSQAPKIVERKLVKWLKEHLNGK